MHLLIGKSEAHGYIFRLELNFGGKSIMKWISQLHEEDMDLESCWRRSHLWGYWGCVWEKVWRAGMFIYLILITSCGRFFLSFAAATQGWTSAEKPTDNSSCNGTQAPGLPKSLLQLRKISHQIPSWVQKWVLVKECSELLFTTSLHFPYWTVQVAMTGKRVTCWTTQDRWEWIEHLCERPRSGSILCSLPRGRSSLEKVVPVWKLRPNPDDSRSFLPSPHVPGLCCHSYNHLEPLLLVPWMQLPEEESIWWLHARNGSYSGPPPLPPQLWGSWWYLSVNIILRNWVPLGQLGPEIQKTAE